MRTRNDSDDQRNSEPTKPIYVSMVQCCHDVMQRCDGTNPKHHIQHMSIINHLTTPHITHHITTSSPPIITQIVHGNVKHQTQSLHRVASHVNTCQQQAARAHGRHGRRPPAAVDVRLQSDAASADTERGSANTRSRSGLWRWDSGRVGRERLVRRSRH